MNRKTIPLNEWLEDELSNPAFRAEYEALEPAYQIARLRMVRGLTQQELAEKVGTQQPSIARIESGRRRASISMLERIAEALDADLRVTLMPR